MLYREIIGVCSDPHKTLCGRNAELLSVKPGGTYGNHCALKSSISLIKTSQLTL